MSLADASTLANHLWQSTLFVAVVGLLVLSLKRNTAQVRYGLWLAASMKFLIPFAALAALGRQFAWHSSVRIVQPEMAFVIGAIGQPFPQPDVMAVSRVTVPGLPALPLGLLAIWLGGCVMHLLGWWVRWQRVAVVVRGASPLEDGRELEALRRLEGIFGTRRPIAAVISNTSIEPGVFGIVRPVLVWPRSIGERLSDRQLEAILAHELCHVRRRDNLTLAIHMVVEAIFWFHPAVWWLERRLVDERERACDEQVMRFGSEPQAYAEGILRTCEFCTESPSIVAGVTGSDLRKRVEAIMRGETGRSLTTWKRVFLAVVAAAAIALPISIGVLHTQPLRAQSQPRVAGARFEVASVKLNENDQGGGYQMLPDGSIRIVNVALSMIIPMASPVLDGEVKGLPNWARTENYDIFARPAPDSHPAPLQLREMIRNLLIDRFKLLSHVEEVERTGYSLVVARGDGRLGPQLTRTTLDCAGADRLECLNSLRFTAGSMEARGYTLDQFAGSVRYTAPGPVTNRTGLDGWYDIKLSYAPPQPDPNAPDDRPQFATAVQEQLGLRLVPEKVKVSVFVIDRIERPTPD